MKFADVRIDRDAWLQMDDATRRDVMRTLKRNYANAGYFIVIGPK